MLPKVGLTYFDLIFNSSRLFQILRIELLFRDVWVIALAPNTGGQLRIVSFK
jgi:hypothetical protein